MRILLVENQETFTRIVIGAFLTSHDVAVRSTLSSAIEELDACDYDAALITYELEDGNGTELVRFLRQSGREILIIGISAKDDENDLLVTAGATDACSKMKFDEIEVVLSKYMK